MSNRTSVVLLHYNNYFNRQVKRLSTLFQYVQADANCVACANINFVPGDGINTSLVLGKGTNPDDIFTGAKDGFDYLVVFDPGDSNNPILSRWFIIETHRTREGQYDIRLRRDVVADHYDEILNSPMYIEKGYINDIKNPLLYNHESLSVNQIKEKEIPIKDKTECGWVVGYIPRDSNPGTVKSSAVFSQGADITVANLSDWAYWDYCDYKVGYKSVAQVKARKDIYFHLSSMYQNGNNFFWGAKRVNSYVGKDETGWTQMAGQSATTNNTTEPTWWTNFAGLKWKSSYAQTGKTSGNSYFGVNNCNWLCKNLYTATWNGNTLNSCLNTVLAAKYNVEFDDSKFDTLSNLNGKILYDQTNNLYYRVVSKSRAWSDRYNVTDSDTGGSTLRSFLNNNIVTTGFPEDGQLTGSIANGDIDMIRLSESSWYLTLEQVIIDVEANITAPNNRIHLEDSPYDMFCIPYSDDLQMTDGTDTWTCNKAVAVSIATDIGAKSGSGNIYDIQILPYCPSEQLINSSIDPSVIVDISSVPHDIVQTTETEPRKITAIIWCPKSTFSFEVDKSIDAAVFGAPYTVDEMVRYDTYYMAPEFPEMASGMSRAAVSYIGGNGLDLYQVDKSTGEATWLTNVKMIEMLNDGTTQTLKISKGTFSSSYEYVSHTRDAYNALPYCYMFKKIGESGTGNQNLEFFMSVFKKPSINDYGTDLSSPERAKMSNDCYLYRLSAGNYSALFEFSPAKSQGYDGYVVDCTYKPFAPWIHIIPKLKGLYGDNFTQIDDARGLICGGDYSLPQVTNAWANYQLNNKTYQDVFDRQMKNMDINNDIARQEQMFQSVSGSLTGGMTGAVSGALTGAKAGPYGAIAGAVVGGVAGTALGITGGVMDYNNLVTRQEEAKSYATDMFNYSLQNIQAIPSGLAKTSALVANTRIWPFLEIFVCTDREKEAYLDKLEYDGMTIMAIGKIVDFKTNAPHYFKGEIIRLPSLKDDAHMANEICMELKKGVYI